MKRNLFLISCLAYFLIVAKPFITEAASFMGGEITWTCIGQDSFIINLTIYRDCNGTQVSSASISVKCATTAQTITTLSIAKPNPVDITPTCAASCTRCQNSSCSFPYGIEKYVYSKLLVLSSAGSCCTINLSYSGCCRLGALTTGAQNTNFYIESTFNRCLSQPDNSPIFANDPLLIQCTGQNQVFSILAFDQDTNSTGSLIDSISYEWTPPLSASGSSVSYTGQYSYDKPLFFWGFPNSGLSSPKGLHLDPTSGDVEYRPMKVEQTNMSFKIREWRSINNTMTQIAEIQRETHVIIISCPTNDPPIITSATSSTVCAGDTVQFIIATDDAAWEKLIISWDKSVPNASWTDNNNQVNHPTAIFKLATTIKDTSSYGQFSVTVKDDECPVKGSVTKVFTYHIKVLPPPAMTIQKTNLGCGYFRLEAYPSYSSLSYDWYGLYKDPFYFNGQSSIVRFPVPGAYPFELIVSGACIMKSIKDTLVAPDTFISVDIPDSIQILKNDSFQLKPQISYATGQVKFKWQDQDSLNLNKWFYYDQQNPIKKAVIQVTDSSGCSITDTTVIESINFKVDCGNDTIKCTNKSVTLKSVFFDKPPNASIQSYTWYKAGKTVPLGYDSMIITSDTGHFICIITLSTGPSPRDTVYVSNYPIPTVYAGNDTILCSESGLFLLEGTPISPSSYWAGTSVLKSGKDYLFDPRGSSIIDGGIYFIYYYYTDTNGCTDNSDYRKIQVYYTPIKPTINFIKPLCVDSDKVLLKADLGPGIWSGQGVVDYEYFNPSIAGAGSHQVIYQAGNAGCLNYDTIYITVKPMADVSLATIFGKTSFCRQYGMVKLLASPAGGTFSGNFVNGEYFNADTIPGTYYISYSYSDSATCLATETIELKVDEPEIEIKKGQEFCINEMVKLIAYSNLDNSVEWSKGINADGTFDGSVTKLNVTYIPGSSDIIKKGFWIKVKTVDSVCKVLEDSAFIRLNPIPVADFYSDPPVYNQLFGEYWDVKLYDASTIDSDIIIYYYWEFGDSSSGGNKDITHRYLNSGTYTVSLEVGSSKMCKSKSIKTEYIVLSFIPDENIYGQRIKCIPNPADDQVIVSSDFEISEISLFNSLGKIVYRESSIGKQFSIQNPGSGIYFLKINDPEGNVCFKKVVFR